MTKRRTIGLAAATALLGGLGTYGAATASATPSAEARPSTTQSSERDGRADAGSMIRHCTDQLPAADRAEARQLMKNMMSEGMMSGTSDSGQSNDDSPSGAERRGMR